MQQVQSARTACAVVSVVILLLTECIISICQQPEALQRLQIREDTTRSQVAVGQIAGVGSAMALAMTLRATHSPVTPALACRPGLPQAPPAARLCSRSSAAASYTLHGPESKRRSNARTRPVCSAKGTSKQAIAASSGKVSFEFEVHASQFLAERVVLGVCAARRSVLERHAKRLTADLHSFHCNRRIFTLDACSALIYDVPPVSVVPRRGSIPSA